MAELELNISVDDAEKLYKKLKKLVDDDWNKSKSKRKRYKSKGYDYEWPIPVKYKLDVDEDLEEELFSVCLKKDIIELYFQTKPSSIHGTIRFKLDEIQTVKSK